MIGIGSFKKYLDETFTAEKSIVLRYHPVICSDSLTLNDLKETSLSEGVRLFKLATYKGVDIFLLDETTLMQTGTYKSIDGCIYTALHRKQGLQRIAFSSGANTGMASSLYAQRFGIETFFFHPKTTLFKINASWFKNPLSHLIAVDRSAKEVKNTAKVFSKLLFIPNGLETNLRILGSRCRALAVCEEMFKNNIKFSYIAQTVCAGFGPIGLYKMFSRLVAENILKREDAPRFLGVQQQAISPMVCAWEEKRDCLSNTNVDCNESPIEPALYNTCPDETYPEMYKLLVVFGGELISISRDDYHKYSDLFILLLLKAGLELTGIMLDGKKELLEKAGIIAGAGVLKSIDNGLIKKKTKVLCCLTGGIIKDFSPLLSPGYEIKKEGPLEEEVKKYIKAALPQAIINKECHVQ